MVGNGEDVRIINKYIGETSNELFEAHRTFKSSGGRFSADDVKEKFAGRNVLVITRTFLEVFDEHNKEVESLIGKDYVKAT